METLLTTIFAQVAGKTITGASFKKRSHGIIFVKLFNSLLKHRTIQYGKGLISDTEEFMPVNACRSGGLYFIPEEDMHKWLIYNYEIGAMCWYSYVVVPDDARVYVESVSKYKANKLELSEPMQILDNKNVMSKVLENGPLFAKWICSMYNDDADMFFRICKNYPNEIIAAICHDHCLGRKLEIFVIANNMCCASDSNKNALQKYLENKYDLPYSRICSVGWMLDATNMDDLVGDVVKHVRQCIQAQMYELLPCCMKTADMWCVYVNNDMIMAKYYPKELATEDNIMMLVLAIKQKQEHNLGFTNAIAIIRHLCSHMAVLLDACMSSLSA